MATYTSQQLYNGVDGPDLISGTTYTLTFTNVLDEISYFTLETYPTSEDKYTVSSPKNLEGSHTLGTVLDFIYDDYKGSIIIPEGNSSMTFTPTNNVVSSTWRVLGTGDFSVTIL